MEHPTHRRCEMERILFFSPSANRGIGKTPVAWITSNESPCSAWARYTVSVTMASTRIRVKSDC
jgi:hypothetical protein